MKNPVSKLLVFSLLVSPALAAAAPAPHRTLSGTWGRALPLFAQAIRPTAFPNDHALRQAALLKELKSESFAETADPALVEHLIEGLSRLEDFAALDGLFARAQNYPPEIRDVAIQRLVGGLTRELGSQELSRRFWSIADRKQLYSLKPGARMLTNKLIDTHVHLSMLPSPENGAILSKAMIDSPLVRTISYLKGYPLDRPEEANRKYVDDLVNAVKASERVGQVVLLGMDGVYDASGNLLKDETAKYIPNDLLMKTAREHSDIFLPGPSINPARRGAIEELHRVAEQGAVLIKVLPNSQAFDPGDARFKSFYDAMVALKMPLLSHIGLEFSIKGKDQTMGDPARLTMALERGVDVIGAHAGSHGSGWERYLPTFLRMMERFTNLYADVSALTLQNRFPALLKLSRHPEIHDRLFFGTDYPLPVWAFPALFAGLGGLGAYLRARRIKNPFDRQASVMESLGFKLTDMRRLIGRR